MCSSIQIHANLYSKTICCSIFYKKQVNNWYIQQILPENENKEGVSGKAISLFLKWQINKLCLCKLNISIINISIRCRLFTDNDFVLHLLLTTLIVIYRYLLCKLVFKINVYLYEVK
jgi:hypothetical protein